MTNPTNDAKFTVTFEDKTLWVTQEPYADGLIEAPVFQAHAVDDMGEAYMVVWAVKENHEEILAAGDESDLCDWENPESVTSI